jgi:hypothetical protein
MNQFENEDVGNIRNLVNANELLIEGIGKPPRNGYHIVSTNNGRIGVLRFDTEDNLNWIIMSFVTNKGAITINMKQSVTKTVNTVLLDNKEIMQKIDEGVKNYSILLSPEGHDFKLKSKILALRTHWEIMDRDNNLILDIKCTKAKGRAKISFQIDPPFSSDRHYLLGIIALLFDSILTYVSPPIV